ncbi:MAG: MobA/MobL family protein [Propylenella sp.]
MAIYSCNLKSIGRSTHEPGTAGAHIRYISRPEAHPVLLSEHMPFEHREARSFIDKAERALRKNARVIDKIRIALPVELDEHQRAALVEEFMAELTGGRVPWLAAIHQYGADEHNPHVHIAAHDRDIETGKRVLRLSDSTRDRRKAGLPGPKAVEWIRERWEAVCNEALARAGMDARIDRRTLAAQGIDRQANIHEGPRAQHIEGNVRRPESKQRVNGCGRLIDYPSIDRGRTRREFNAQIIDLNLERAARSKNPVTRVWAQFEKGQSDADRKLERRLAAEEHERTETMRSVSRAHLLRIDRLRSERDRAIRSAVRDVRVRFTPERDGLRRRQGQERAALKDRQSRLFARIAAVLDVTGITRRQQEAARKVLSTRHKEERQALSQRYHDAKRRAVGTIRSQSNVAIKNVQRERQAALASLRQQQIESRRSSEAQRQQREIEREHARQIAQKRIEAWSRTRRDAGPLGVESGFAKAMQRAAKKEADRGGRSGKGRDRDRDRGR